MTMGWQSRMKLQPWDGKPLLDHAEPLRNDEGLQQAWRDPLARLLLVDQQSRFPTQPFGMATDGDLDFDTAFLGVAGGNLWFAKRGGDFPDGGTLRLPGFTDWQYQVASTAIAVLNWTQTARYCATCGGALKRIKGGFAAQCTGCNLEVYPRTDPAVIVAVLDPDDRVFLAHQSAWPPAQASLLAGFVEAGESAEHAVHREVLEESGLVVDSMRFLGSQPWPFPRSLMLAYVARTHTTNGRVDTNELEWGGWYSRQDVLNGQVTRKVVLPGAGSVARMVIDSWLAGKLPRPE